MFSFIDRSEGGSSIHDGSIELMVHRRTLYDDGLGVHEPLNETAYGAGLTIRGKHFLILEPPESSALYHRPAAQHLFMSPLSTYALVNVSYTNYASNYRQTWSAIENELLPYNVHLLTFDQWSSKVYLVRVEHYFQINEDDTYSKPVEIDLQILFKALGKISDVVQLGLAANIPLNEMTRLVWNTNDNQSSYYKSTSMKIKCKLN